MVISSSGGYTAKLVLEEIQDSIKLIVVGFPSGSPEKMKMELESLGHKVLFPSVYSFARAFCLGLDIGLP